MSILTWIMSRISLRKIGREDSSSIQSLRKEIKRLRKENIALKEKIIIFPQKNNENVPVKFFDEGIENVIIENLRQAKEEVCIAVAWFTSDTLMNVLKDLKRRGVEIKVIISSDEKNNRNKLISACSMLKQVIIPSSGNRNYSNLMHNKYCIIDNKKVIDGSYNWSNSAKYNLEHVIVIDSRTIAKMYKDSFDKIYNNPKYYSDLNVYYDLG